jgi:hypothetical protein
MLHLNYLKQLVFDFCTCCLQVVSISLEQVVQCAANATGPHGLQSVQTGQGAVMQPLCNAAQRDSSSAIPLPLIVGARNRVDTMHVPLQLSSFRELMSGPGAAAEPQPGPITIYLRARGQHTPFVCAYVIVLTLMCVALGLYLLVAALDQAFVRPRPLNPTAINCFAGGFFNMPRAMVAEAVVLIVVLSLMPYSGCHFPCGLPMPAHKGLPAPCVSQKQQHMEAPYRMCC